MKRALHNLSHEVLTTFNQGELIPIALYEGLPNDVIRGSSSALLRTQPLMAPIMHKVRVSMYHASIPLRLIWADFEDFRTGNTGNNTPSSIDAPYIMSPPSTGFAVGSLADYLGCPTGVPDLKVSALPFRAYALFYNTYIRDKDLDTELVISTGNGLDTTTNTALQNASWEKDYFTSARPYPQKGSAVSIPLTGDAEITGTGVVKKLGSGIPTFDTASGGNNLNIRVTGGGTGLSIQSGYTGSGTDTMSWDTPNLTMDANDVGSTLEADLSSVQAVDIEDLRVASAMQRFAELLSKFGHTLPEFYRLFGVSPQDSRMQWPELIGSGSSIIQFSEVLQTAEGTDPVGELRGHGISSARSNRFKYFVQEDCIILSLMCVRPKTVYQDGLNKMWSRESRWDYFMPALQNLGQQPIKYKEVQAAHLTPDGVFGYQDQYDEYRRIPSRVSGEFRDTLDFWHMARQLPTDVALNSSFVKANPTDRIYATDADQLQVRVMNSIKAKRLVYKTSRPELK